MNRLINGMTTDSYQLSFAARLGDVPGDSNGPKRLSMDSATTAMITKTTAATTTKTNRTTSTTMMLTREQDSIHYSVSIPEKQLEVGTNSINTSYLPIMKT